jgi:hypothetical protein
MLRSGDADMLFYLAAASSGTAKRHLMIPHLIESLRSLSPSDSILQAFVNTNKSISHKWAESSSIKWAESAAITERPAIYSTLSKKFCIGKTFCDQPLSAKKVIREELET